VILKESDLYLPTKDWLEDKGWEVFAEVSGACGVADVVGKQGKARCVIEMKTSLSHDVIDQAIRWRGYAHYIYIVIPTRKKGLPRYLNNLFKEKGIGVLEVELNNKFNETCVYQKLPARFRKAYNLGDYDWNLREEHKTFAVAGSSGASHWTPYKATMGDVKDYMSRGRVKHYNDGWVSINDILDHCETHYANPKTSLVKSLVDFESDWCESKKINRKWHFRHKKDNK
jgi:hypothetical protein